MVALAPNLHFGKCITVAKVSHQDSEQTGERNPWARGKNLVVSGIVFEKDCGRNQQLSSGDGCADYRAKDRKPNDAPCLGIAVNLSQDVCDQIGKRKVNNRDGDSHAKNRNDARRRKIRDEEKRYVEACEQA
jgi:hypothetical protein